MRNAEKDVLKFNRNFDTYVKHQECTAEQMRPYNEAVGVFAHKFHMIEELQMIKQMILGALRKGTMGTAGTMGTMGTMGTVGTMGTAGRQCPQCPQSPQKGGAC